MKKVLAAAMLVSAFAISACDNNKPAEDQTGEAASPAQPETSAPETAVATSQDPFLADNLKNPGWGATASGLQFRPPEPRAVEGATQPTANSVVTVHYEGKLTNGQIFDTSYGSEPVTFPLSNVITGWQEAVPMMRVGETWEFAIPADLAYGDNSPPPIPPGSTLLFKIELLEIK